ncbi:MAG: type II toxin-antitoxin system RelE family toxin [Chthoniobacterales bacterium]
MGDYRIVYTVDDTVLIVAIERVRHRREVYRLGDPHFLLNEPDRHRVAVEFSFAGLDGGG